MNDGALVPFLHLPCSTAACDLGPVVEHSPGQLTLRYDAESDLGVVWTTVEFTMVVALRFTPDPACAAWMIGAYSQVCELVDSSWRWTLRADASGLEVFPASSARHLVLYFDHVGCWEVLADGARLVV